MARHLSFNSNNHFHNICSGIRPFCMALELFVHICLLYKLLKRVVLFKPDVSILFKFTSP